MQARAEEWGHRQAEVEGRPRCSNGAPPWDGEDHPTCSVMILDTTRAPDGGSGHRPIVCPQGEARLPHGKGLDLSSAL